jgi:hypothetical protein
MEGVVAYFKTLFLPLKAIFCIIILRFIAAPRMTDLSQRKSESAGIYCDSCGDQDNEKRNALYMCLHHNNIPYNLFKVSKVAWRNLKHVVLCL